MSDNLYQLSPSKPKGTALYRFFDTRGRLLYVGIADMPGRRFAQHERKEWWRDVIDINITWYKTRRAALDEEARAINYERPLHNVQAPQPSPREPAYVSEHVEIDRDRVAYLDMICESLWG
jgi:excinuclease UvrABC nuclease subunit